MDIEEVNDNDDYIYSSSPDNEDKVYIYNGSESCPLYTKHHAIPRSNEKTIRPDLEKLGLPSNIINTADNIFQTMDVGTKRGKRRRMLLFYCSFTAYNQQNIPIDPFTLAKNCGLDRSGISKALSMCSPVQTNLSTPLVRYTPLDYIPVYFDKLNEDWIEFPSGALDDIYKITKEVLSKDLDLSDEKPQTVAAAILVFYLQMNGFSIDKLKYQDIFGRSDMTINKIKKRISKAYNE